MKNYLIVGIVFFGTFLFLLPSCCIVFKCPCTPQSLATIKAGYNPLEYHEKVTVLTVDELPENAIKLGEVLVAKDVMNRNCSYGHLMDKVQIEARKYGGNIIVVTSVSPKKPDKRIVCRRITADIYRFN